VAVATKTPGFTTLPGLLPAFAFHVAISVAGLALVGHAAPARSAEEPAVAPEAAEVAGSVEA
jgi:hypothetical protein